MNGGVKSSLSKAIIKALWNFFRTYIVKLSIMDGFSRAHVGAIKCGKELITSMPSSWSCKKINIAMPI